MSFPKTTHGRPRTPWAVLCGGSRHRRGYYHGLVYLTKQEYNRQMDQPDSLWKCPICGCSASWDDDNYSEMS